MKYHNLLTPRDRKVLSFALPIMLLLVTVLLVRFAYGERKQAEQNLQQYMDDLGWLETHPIAVSEIQCTPLQEQPAVLAIAEKMGVRIVVDDTDISQVKFLQSPGNQVLRFLELLSCDGWLVESLNLITTSTGQVEGKASFSHL